MKRRLEWSGVEALGRSREWGRIVFATALVAALMATQAGTKGEGQAKPRNRKCRGVVVRPGMNIQAVVNGHPPGTTFCLKTGTYRLSAPIDSKDGQRFVGVGSPTLSGAKILSAFAQEGAFWVAQAQTQEHPTNPHGSCRPSSYTGCQYAEGVFFDNRNLRQVTSLTDLVSGTFYFDYAADAIYLADDPAGHVVEASVSPAAFGWAARRVEIRGFVIEKFANPAQSPAVGSTGAKRWAIVSNEVRLNHGIGICGGSRSLVRRNYVHHQGQMGLCGHGHAGVYERNEVAYNNTEGFEWGWEAGGAKWVGTKDLVARDNRVHDNVGHALWTDTGNIGSLYEGNRIRNNDGAGIIHESSGSALIRDNVVVGNGFAAGGWDRAGILVGASRNVRIMDNVVSRNGWGIFAKQHGPGPPFVEGLRVIGNKIVMCEGHTGVELGIEAPRLFRRGVNRFERNHYHVGTETPMWWRWLQDGQTWSDWRSYGHDNKGTVRRIKC